MDEQITILVVDDDPDVREVLAGAIYNQGYRVIFAENGVKGIQLANEYTPDVVLLDVMMPFMDGFEVCRRLRSDSKTSEIPVLMITALNDPASRLKGIDAGADDYISKPFDRAEIRARVRSITRLNRYRRLMAERARFEWVVNNASDAYIMIDALGEIRYANGSARTLLNLPVEKSMDAAGDENQPLFLEWAQQRFNLMPPSAWKEWPQMTDPTLPLYLIRPQDEQSGALWYQVHILDLPWGSEGFLLLRIHEVTETVNFVQEMWSFQAAISHKFNTPLSSIVLASGLVKFVGERNNMPDLIEYAKAIEGGAKRLEGELNDIMEFVNAPSLMYSEGKFSLATLAELVKVTAQDLNLQQVRFIVKSESLLQHDINISRRAMQVVLWELLENTKKFHPNHSPEVEIVLSPSQTGAVLLTITDNGISLPPDQITKAYIPYYQGEKTFTGEVVGMGLGLPTVASVVWAGGGNIRLYNRTDHVGIVVELSLPLVD